MSESEKISVVVDIFGVQYTLITDSTLMHARKMASIVDDLMTTNDKKFPRLETYKLAVLAALQLADQNLQLEKENQQLQDDSLDPTQTQPYLKLREDYLRLKQAYLELKQKTDK
jgi:cell division protein ZapA (FtsZ GTPase activity inhibitor)